MSTIRHQNRTRRRAAGITGIELQRTLKRRDRRLARDLVNAALERFVAHYPADGDGAPPATCRRTE